MSTSTFNFRRMVMGWGTPFRRIFLTGAGVISHAYHAFKFWSTWGSGAKLVWLEEDVTLSGASPADGTGTLLPAGSLILGVTYRIVTAIAGATAFTIGDSGSGTRFFGAQTTYTAGTTGAAGVIGDNQQQVAAGQVRVAWTGTATAGKLRVGVWAIVFTAPTVS